MERKKNQKVLKLTKERTRKETKEINDMEMHMSELNLMWTIENNVSVRKMKESMKAPHEGKLELNEIELETCEIEKGIERKKC